MSPKRRRFEAARGDDDRPMSRMNINEDCGGSSFFLFPALAQQKLGNNIKKRGKWVACAPSNSCINGESGAGRVQRRGLELLEHS